jgi:hypothetical protein
MLHRLGCRHRRTRSVLGRSGLRLEAPCVEDGVAHKIRNLTVRLLTARFQREIHGARAGILGRRRAGDDLELIDGIEVDRLGHQTVVALLTDCLGRHAIEIKLPEIVARAADDRQTRSTLRSRRKCSKGRGIALRIVHLQWQICVRRVLHDKPDGRVGRVQHGGRRRHNDSLSRLAQRQGWVESQRVQSVDRKVVLPKRLESLGCDLDRIDSWRQRRDRIRARARGRTRCRHIRRGVRRRHCRIRNSRTRGVRHGARYCTFTGSLRPECRRHPKDREHGEQAKHRTRRRRENAIETICFVCHSSLVKNDSGWTSSSSEKVLFSVGEDYGHPR